MAAVHDNTYILLTTDNKQAFIEFNLLCLVIPKSYSRLLIPHKYKYLVHQFAVSSKNDTFVPLIFPQEYLSTFNEQRCPNYNKTCLFFEYTTFLV